MSPFEAQISWPVEDEEELAAPPITHLTPHQPSRDVASILRRPLLLPSEEESLGSPPAPTGGAQPGHQTPASPIATSPAPAPTPANPAPASPAMAGAIPYKQRRSTRKPLPPLELPPTRPDDLARKEPPLVPPVPRSVADTGLDASFISDLMLRILYFRGNVSGGGIAQALRLPYSGLVDGLLESLRQQQFVEVQGSSGLLSTTYKYILSDKGNRKVQELLQRTTYAGACPVTLDDYTYMMSRQRARDARVTRSLVEDRYSEMVLAPTVLEQLGPAINSGESIFVFGAPGNGKTMIAEIATTCLGGDVYIPHALYVEGEIIRIFDDSLHIPVQETSEDVDERWVRAKRPTVIAGGELTLDALDLTYSRESKTYEAPLQLKANSGMFLIDDFGRQQCSPAALLNRWIVPLEKHVDYLSTITGIKVKVPFEELIVFSTNLAPQNLVDDAFLRRLQYKIEVLPPTPDQFREIFKRVAKAKGVAWSEQGFQYLLKEVYAADNREPQACHPRDLLNQLLSISRYYDVPPQMSNALIARAAYGYFVQID